MSESTVCGREYTTHKRKFKGKDIAPRYTVAGIFHLGGKPKKRNNHAANNIAIRFKSLKAAENHIKNMRLEQ